MFNKKGLSEVVSYVLLVVIAISLSLLVYAWMKGLLWKNPKECPEGVSLIIADYTCNSAIKNITITFRNNGLFGIEGFIARISNETGKLTTKPLLGGEPINGDFNGNFFFNQALKPNEEFTNSFSYSDYDKIVELEIVPLKLVGTEMLLCDNSALKQQLDGCE